MMCIPFWSLLRLVFLLALVSVTREQETGPPIIPSPITNTLPNTTTSLTSTSNSTPRVTTIILTRSSSTQTDAGMGTTSTRVPGTSASMTVSGRPGSVLPSTTSSSTSLIDISTPTPTIIPNSSVDPNHPWTTITFAVGIAFLVVEYV
ncbi:hypothetical protein RSOL_509700 [Rhizoctonia solani AG-3 Rhs1AP]|uniref:Transmembrane protein n=2 Tax=Rhizoctonia solani AG-3 TaxID=1086053 RepID=A0A074SAQ9_9AGAM|nr:hypothetical protein RSOL_509700 [Rhizoctonia solani AG-3 Rhs1AP]KEP53983.1 hypothetical protein V565_023630 [Rhizoctonia solani 123E]